MQDVTWLVMGLRARNQIKNKDKCKTYNSTHISINKCGFVFTQFPAPVGHLVALQSYKL